MKSNFKDNRYFFSSVLENTLLARDTSELMNVCLGIKLAGVFK